jgi:uncharacterized protein YndB with AHSA1/START domain
MKIVASMLLFLVLLLGGFYFYASRKIYPITVERTFNMPVEKAWKNWVEADSIKKWWGPKNYSAPIIQNDLKVGSTFLYSMKSPKGDVTWNTGKYSEIIPNKKIVSTISFSDETATTITASQAGVLGQWAYQVILTVNFEDVGGKTKVTVYEEGIPLIMSVFAKLGWEQQFDKFEKL